MNKKRFLELLRESKKGINLNLSKKERRKFVKAFKKFNNRKVNYTVFYGIKHQLERASRIRFNKNRIVDVIAFDRPTNNPNWVGTVRFLKYAS